jgi:GT2 family glycosyltransferase
MTVDEGRGRRADRADNELAVVVPTRDRPARLAACLAALGRQTFDRFEVIVVDDGGRTPAADLLPPTTGGGPPVTLLRNTSSLGPGASRNRGVAHSRAAYLVFLDDDCIAEPDLVASHHAALAGSVGPVVSLGPILPVPGRRLPVWRRWDAEHLEQEYARLAGGAASPGWRHLYTGNVGVRRADFLAVGGFDPRFVRQEDVELGYRLHRFGCRFAFDPAAAVHHDCDRSLRSWRRIPAATARFDVLMDRLVPDSAVRLGRRDRRRPRAARVARRAIVAGGAQSLLGPHVQPRAGGGGVRRAPAWGR